MFIIVRQLSVSKRALDVAGRAARLRLRLGLEFIDSSTGLDGTTQPSAGPDIPHHK